jgi:hypothetical protein
MVDTKLIIKIMVEYNPQDRRSCIWSSVLFALDAICTKKVCSDIKTAECKNLVERLMARDEPLPTGAQLLTALELGLGIASETKVVSKTFEAPFYILSFCQNDCEEPVELIKKELVRRKV